MFPPVTGLVKLIIGAIEFFLGLRFLLRLLGANAEAPFVSWIYEMSAPLLAPFEGIFPSARVEGLVFDFTTLFALLVYVFIGYLILEAVAYISYAARRRA